MKDAIEVQREKTILALLKAIEDLALQIKKGLHEPGQTASAAYDLARACAEIDLDKRRRIRRRRDRAPLSKIEHLEGERR